MDVVWYCTVKRVSSMGLALSTSFRLKMLIVTWAFGRFLLLKYYSAYKNGYMYVVIME